MSTTDSVSESSDCMALPQTIIADLKADLRGEVLQSQDVGYDDARKIWNAMIDRYPGLIIRCNGVSDVMAAVNLARTNNLLVSVKGGGHNVSGHAVCDGGLMIDLSPMKSIYVNTSAQTARAEGGATWKEYDRETQTFGLASTGGAVSHTGIAGLTLGGGWGWLAGMHGLACDNLLSVDVVTADGKLVTASAEQNKDLFWGLRGGGGNFGVATSFEYALHPVGEVLAGTFLAFLCFLAALIVCGRSLLSPAGWLRLGAGGLLGAGDHGAKLAESDVPGNIFHTAIGGHHHAFRRQNF